MNTVAEQQLSELFGERFVRAETVLQEHGRDPSCHPAAAPEAVVYPTSTGELQALARCCSAHGIGMIPYGAGSSVEGATLATAGGIAVDLSKMNRIIEIDHTNQYAIVEAGVTRLQLGAALESSGLFFSVDPGADATLAGMASTRASGTNTVRYGTIRENVYALEVVLADGTQLRTGSRARKSAAGYDLTRLFIGAEGTLGFITELTVKLYPCPQAISAAVCTFSSVDDAVQTVVELQSNDIRVARVELLDPVAIDAVNHYADRNDPLAPTLFLEFHGSEASVAERAQAAQTIATSHGGSDFRWSTDDDERRSMWHARHNAYYAVRERRPGAIAVSTDICAPISQLSEIIRESREDAERHQLEAPMVGHVGDGNVHFIILADPNSRKEIEAANAFHGRLVDRALAAGGTCSGEHGIGIGKREFLEREHGVGVDIMRAIKRQLDPQGLMNPGKVFSVDREPQRTSGPARQQ